MTKLRSGAMNFARGFQRSPPIVEIALTLAIVTSTVFLGNTSATTETDGSDVTPSEVNDRTHYKTGGEIVQPLRIAAVEVDSFFTRQLTPSGDSFSGYLVDVVREISRIVPFQFQWLMVEREEVNRRKRKNGNNWTKLTEKLLNGTANVVVFPINSVSLDDARRFSYTQPFLKSTLSVLVRAPDTLSDHRPLLLENLLNDTDHSRLGFGVSNEGVARQLKASNSSLYHRMWKDRSPSEVVVPLEEGLRKVRGGDFALLMESMEATYHSSRQPCDLLALDQFTHETSYVFATMRNDSVVGRLDGALARLREGDFLGDLFRKWWDTDECTLRRDETNRDDSDLDMERIFFTSPIKFFKSKVDTPDGLHDSTRYGSLTTEKFARTFKLDAYHEDRNRRPGVSVTVSTRPYVSEEFGHGRLHTIAEYSTRSAEMEWHKEHDRTTHIAPPLPPTSVSSSFRVQPDPELHQKSQRRSRTRRPRQTSTMTTPTSLVQPRIQVPSTSTHPHTDFEVRSPVIQTSPTSSKQNVRWSESLPGDELDEIQHSRHLGQKESHTVTAHIQSKTTKSRDFAKDFDWVFATQQPRYDEEMNYEDDDYDDDDDDVYREQSVTIRVVEVKQKGALRGQSSKDTGAKSDAKPSHNSSGISSLSKVDVAIVRIVLAAFVAIFYSF